MSTYISQGTISFHWKLVNDKREAVVLFIPDSDHSIKRANKTFAVFMPETEGYDKAILKAYDKDKDDKVELVELEAVSVHMDVISYAVTHQTVVRVWVEERLKAGRDNVTAIQTAVKEAEKYAIAATRKGTTDATATAKAVESITRAANVCGSEGRSELKLTGIAIPAK